MREPEEYAAEAIAEIVCIFESLDPPDRARAFALIRKLVPKARELMALENDQTLEQYDEAYRKAGVSIREFARQLAAENKKRPKAEQRGPKGTDIAALDHHIRELLRKRSRDRRRLIQLCMESGEPGSFAGALAARDLKGFKVTKL